MRRPRFTTVRMRVGYDSSEVDAAVDRVMATLAGDATPRLSVAEIEELRFTPVSFRAAYDMGEVDVWLDEVVAELDRRRAGAAGVSTTSPRAADPSPPAAPAPAARPEPHPAAVEEVDGSMSPVMTALAVIGVLLLALVVLYVV